MDRQCRVSRWLEGAGSPHERFVLSSLCNFLITRQNSDVNFRRRLEHVFCSEKLIQCSSLGRGVYFKIAFKVYFPSPLCCCERRQLLSFYREIRQTPRGSFLDLIISMMEKFILRAWIVATVVITFPSSASFIPTKLQILMLFCPKSSQRKS